MQEQDDQQQQQQRTCWDRIVKRRRQDCATFLEDSVVEEVFKKAVPLVDDDGDGIVQFKSPLDQVEHVLNELFEVASNKTLKPQKRRKAFETIQQLRKQLDEAVAAGRKTKQQQQQQHMNGTTATATKPRNDSSLQPPASSSVAATTNNEKAAVVEPTSRPALPPISSPLASLKPTPTNSKTVPPIPSSSSVPSKAPATTSTSSQQRKSPVTVPAGTSNHKNSSQSSSSASKQRFSTASLAAASTLTTEEAASAIPDANTAANTRTIPPISGTGKRWGAPAPASVSNVNGVAPPPYQRTSDTVAASKETKAAKGQPPSKRGASTTMTTGPSTSSATNDTGAANGSRAPLPPTSTGTMNGQDAATLKATSCKNDSSSSSSKRRNDHTNAVDNDEMDISDGDDENSTGPKRSSQQQQNAATTDEPPKKIPRTEKKSPTPNKVIVAASVPSTAFVLDTKTTVHDKPILIDFPPDEIPKDRSSSLCYSFSQRERHTPARVVFKKHWPSNEMLMGAGRLFEMWEPFWQVEAAITAGVTAKVDKVMWAAQSKKPSVTPLTVGTIDMPILEDGLASKISWGTNKLDASRKPKDGDYALLLRMLPIQIDPKYKNKRANCHLWPKGTFITINGKPIMLQQRKQASHDHTKWEYQCHPLDLAQYIKSPKDKPRLEMWCYDPAPFLYTIAVCCYKSPTSLTLGLLQPTNPFMQRLSLEESCEKAMTYIHQQSVSIDDDEDEVSSSPDVGRLIFSVLDPISKQPMKTPVRGQRCKHWQVSAQSSYHHSYEVL